MWLSIVVGLGFTHTLDFLHWGTVKVTLFCAAISEVHEEQPDEQNQFKAASSIHPAAVLWRENFLLMPEISGDILSDSRW